jgi:hypothetical protein
VGTKGRGGDRERALANEEWQGEQQLAILVGGGEVGDKVWALSLRFSSSFEPVRFLLCLCATFPYKNGTCACHKGLKRNVHL